MYSRVLHRVAPPTSCSNRNRRAVPNRQPSSGRGSGLRPFARRLTTNTSRAQSNRYTRAYTFTTLRRRGAVRRRASKATTTVFVLVDAGPRERACQSRDSHMVWRPRAQLSVRRFKRYVTVPAGPIIGRRDGRRPIGRALAESRGKTKCSVNVARRK